MGREQGITDAQLADLANFENSTHFNPREKTVLGAPRLRPSEELASLVANLESLRRQASVGSLEVRGTPLSQLPEPLRQAIIRVVGEREHAARWLVGERTAYPGAPHDPSWPRRE